MHLTNIDMVKIIICILYACSGIVYLKELFLDFKDERPKVFSECFWYVLLLIGGFVPVLNTIVSYQIIKREKKDER